MAVTLGGDLVRLAPSQYAGPGGDAELLGLYFADAGQHLEHRLFVDHGAPNCRSRVTYKGALQGDGRAHGVVGDVLIRAEATGTDTYELNRNLVLTDGARADSVPNLEIETGEVAGAGHASATGRFDDEQLFYLQARGIPEEEARRLVVRGFFAELIGQIGVPELRERLDGGDRGGAGGSAGMSTSSSSVLRAVGRPRRAAPRRRRASTAFRCVWSGPSGQVLRDQRRLLARGRAAVRGRGRRHHHRMLAARLAASTCAPASRPGCPPPSRCRSTRSRSTATTCFVTLVTMTPYLESIMSALEIRDLHVSVTDATGEPGDSARRRPDRPSGQTHAIMGPNGSGKSTLAYSIAGHPKYTVTRGTVTLDGADVLAMTVDERARAGLFLAMQYPVEVPGVSVVEFPADRDDRLRGEAPKLRTGSRSSRRPMNSSRDGPGVRRPQRQRGLLRRREEAPRDPAAGTAASRRSRSWTRPTPAWTSTRCGSSPRASTGSRGPATKACC